ncbi:MAG: hypothetical protein AVDCRST_MAG40-439, partial [uncultured Gemmatimonadaceae bacterium]
RAPWSPPRCSAGRWGRGRWRRWRRGMTTEATPSPRPGNRA